MTRALDAGIRRDAVNLYSVNLQTLLSPLQFKSKSERNLYSCTFIFMMDNKQPFCTCVKKNNTEIS